MVEDILQLFEIILKSKRTSPLKVLPTSPNIKKNLGLSLIADETTIKEWCCSSNISYILMDRQIFGIRKKPNTLLLYYIIINFFFDESYYPCYFCSVSASVSGIFLFLASLVFLIQVIIIIIIKVCLHLRKSFRFD